MKMRLPLTALLLIGLCVCLPAPAQDKPDAKPRVFLEDFLKITIDEKWELFVDTIAPSYLFQTAEQYGLTVDEYKQQLIAVMKDKVKTKEKFVGYKFISEEKITDAEYRFVMNQQYQPPAQGAEPRWEEETLWVVNEHGQWFVSFNGSDPVPEDAKKTLENFVSLSTQNKWTDALQLVYPDYFQMKGEKVGKTAEEYRASLAAAMNNSTTTKTWRIRRQRFSIPPAVCTFAIEREVVGEGKTEPTVLDEKFILQYCPRDKKWYVLLQKYPLEQLTFEVKRVRDLGDGFWEVTAKATNTGELIIRHAEINCIFSNESGNIVAFEKHGLINMNEDLDLPLRPGDSMNCTVKVKYDGADKNIKASFTSYKVRISE